MCILSRATSWVQADMNFLEVDVGKNVCVLYKNVSWRWIKNEWQQK